MSRRPKPRASLVLVAAAAAVLAAGGAAADGGRDLAAFTPASLLAPGETEVVAFQNVYTQTRIFDRDGRRRDAGGRSTWATTLLSWSRGAGARWNAGADAALRVVNDATATRRDPPAETDRRAALAWIAPRIEFAPWESRPGLSLEASVRIPTARHLDGADGDDADDRPEGPWLDSGDVTLVGKLRGQRNLSARSYVYAESGGELRLDGNGPDGGSTPLTLVFHLLPADAVTLYAPLSFTPFWGGKQTGDWSSQVGLGAKLRPRAGLEAEALVTTFPAGRNQGAGHAFNLGLRIVR